ncbi:MAG: hypothetical protein KBG15_03775 [Kofleriaceae bacterium]|nr:hypothetical protein [Kofleriaceae bacterium]
MISADLTLTNIDERHWKNWWHLIVPPRVVKNPQWALAVVAGDPPVLQNLVIRSGRESTELVAPALPALTPHGLQTWARELGVHAVVVIDAQLLTTLSREIESQLSLQQDFAEQGLLALRHLKPHVGQGIWSSPQLLELLPTPSYEPMQRTFDLLLPNNSAMLAYIIENDRSRVHASMIATKAAGNVTQATTHRAIGDLVPETGFARDWQTSYRRVLAAVEERIAKPSVGLFLTREAWMRVLLGPADQLGRELNNRSIIIDPAPAWLLGLLGGASVAAVAGRGARALASFLPSAARERANAFAARAQTAMKESGAHPFGLLGFDPLELWASLKQFYRP